MAHEFTFACPECGTRLSRPAQDELRCPRDGHRYDRIEGIWRFLTPQRAAHFAQFILEYETVRRGENRGSDNASYYRAIPFADVSGSRTVEWQIRAQSFRKFVAEILAPLEQGEPLHILDLGAGNGWLSNQLSRRGHRLMAVDVTLDQRDGLGAHVHYETNFTPVQADFDRLPSPDGQFDLALFNASFHYSPDFGATLAEAFRVVGMGGAVVIVDTPLYHDGESGKRMVQERQACFQRQYGFPSNALGSEDFLTYRRLELLAAAQGAQVDFHWPVSRWRWRLRRWRERWRGRREPAQLPLILLQKASSGA